MNKRNKTYWLFGRHAVEAALENQSRNVIRVVATKNIVNEMSVGKAEVVSPVEIARLVPDGAVHQGIAAEVTPLPELDLEDLKDSRVVVILDQVTDPHNIGAILRSAAAFAAGGVIIQDKNSPNEGGTLAKAASGALESVPLIKAINISQVMEELKGFGFWCVGLDGEAKGSIASISEYEKIALVMGAEGKGIRRLVKENCDILAKIPMQDSIESLNVSNAAAIALYEISR